MKTKLSSDIDINENKKRDNKDRITRAGVQLLPQAVRDRDDMMDNAESFKSM